MAFPDLFEPFDETSPQEEDSDDESGCSYISEEEDEVIKLIRSSIATAPNSSSPHRQQTRNFSIAHQQADSLAKNVLAVLQFMSARRLNLPILLDALFWGCRDLVDNPTARWQRTAFLTSKQLLVLLQRWAKPPAEHDRSHNRGRGASAYMDAWAEYRVKTKLEKELHTLVQYYRAPKEFLSEKYLTSISFTGVMEKFKSMAPTTWSLFRSAAFSRQQEKRKIKKNPDLVSSKPVSLYFFY
jgi:hypothetical protein